MTVCCVKLFCSDWTEFVLVQTQFSRFRKLPNWVTKVRLEASKTFHHEDMTFKISGLYFERNCGFPFSTTTLQLQQQLRLNSRSITPVQTFEWLLKCWCLVGISRNHSTEMLKQNYSGGSPQRPNQKDVKPKYNYYDKLANLKKLFIWNFMLMMWGL